MAKETISEDSPSWYTYYSTCRGCIRADNGLLLHVIDTVKVSYWSKL